MYVSPQIDKSLHQKLPIDADEKILGVFKHHWFIYVISWAVGIGIALLIMIAAAVMILLGGDGTGLDTGDRQVLAIASACAMVVLLGSFIPVYLRAQERLVLTDEALLQILEPSLFASKIDQLALQHVADVSVKKDFFGIIFSYGSLTIETPGEQNNFVFVVMAEADRVAREIMEAQENYVAALEAGRLLNGNEGHGTHVDHHTSHHTSSSEIDPEQYQQFLEYQRMVAKQKEDTAQHTK